MELQLVAMFTRIDRQTVVEAWRVAGARSVQQCRVWDALATAACSRDVGPALEALAALDDWDDECNGFTARGLAATSHAADMVRPLLERLDVRGQWATTLPGTIWAWKANTSRLSGSTRAFTQWTSLRPVAALSPKVSTRVKFSRRLPAASSSGLSTRK